MFATLTICSVSKQAFSQVLRAPKADAAVFFVKNAFSIKTESHLKAAVKSLKGSSYSYKNKVYTWDLKGGILDGTNQRGSGGQSEDQEPLARIFLPLTIKNGFIRNNKDALLFLRPNGGADSLTWLNVGEDALATVRGAYDFTAKNCEVRNDGGGDKSFQFNEAKGLRVMNNVIVKGTTGMRIGDSKTTSVSERAYVCGNTFHNVDTAYHLSKITVEETCASTYNGVSTKWKHANGSKLISSTAEPKDIQ